ncbi:hypothetical protein ACHAWF_012670 [Thalassiosira exigua]
MDVPPCCDGPDPVAEAPMASIAPNASGRDANSASLHHPGHRGGVLGANICHGVARTPYALYAHIVAPPSSLSSSNLLPSDPSPVAAEPVFIIAQLLALHDGQEQERQFVDEQPSIDEILCGGPRGPTPTLSTRAASTAAAAAEAAIVTSAFCRPVALLAVPYR